MGPARADHAAGPYRSREARWDAVKELPLQPDTSGAMMEGWEAELRERLEQLEAEADEHPETSAPSGWLKRLTHRIFGEAPRHRA